MNFVFFGAHPDDLEILCGGTIAAYAAAGHSIWIAVATNGNVGSPTFDKAQTAELRKKEAAAAAQKLGAAGLIWLDENDEFLFDDERTRLKFVDAVRQARADIIITHNPSDYHPDHIACSKLASDARILSAVRLIDTAHSPLEKGPELFYMDSIAGINFMPQFYVDIGETFATKMEALRQHDSQNAWLKKIFNQELLDLARVQSEFRGMQAGCRYAGAFLQPGYWPRQGISLPFVKASV
jgi:LmbE family N-acetylglucosaminyl deacetylase